MRILTSTCHCHASVVTDLGDFIVLPSGEMTRLHEDLNEYRWFDENKYNEEDLDQIRQAGMATIYRIMSRIIT